LRFRLLTILATVHIFGHNKPAKNHSEMVIIEGKKFACGACIKGHRSTRCTHSDRTLLEIGKKGRPPTQCTHCRELRKTSRVHSKCMCGDRPTQTTRRLRVLPNGTSSLLEQDQSETIDLVNQILNPCTCSYGGKCCCAAPAHPTVGTRARNPKKKPSNSDTPSSTATERPATDSPPIQSSSAPNCCARSASIEPTNLDSPSGPSRSFPSAAPAVFHPYTPLNTLPLPATSSAPLSHPSPLANSTLNSSSTQSHSNLDSPPFITQPALFAPRTAGTALCFCGIHCPCPGCVLHDPLGLKFQSGSEAQCPTSMRNSEGCIAGLDLPTVNGLLNLSPISVGFPKAGTTSSTESGPLLPSLPSPHMQLPGVSEKFGILHAPTTTSLSSFEQGFHSIPDDQRYPPSSLAGCCSSPQKSSSVQTSTRVMGCCTANGRPGQDSQSPTNAHLVLSGCCSNQGASQPISCLNKRAGCCGGSGGTDGDGVLHESRRPIGGCCGSNTPDVSPSNLGPGMATAATSCSSSTLAPDLTQSHYPSGNRNLTHLTQSSAAGYYSPVDPFNQSNLLQDQVI